MDRYDKIIHVLSPSEAGKKKTGDRAHYSSGTRSVVFKVKGITFGVLICSDFRKPQLYHHYKSLGVQVMLRSYHNGGQRKQHLDKYKNVWGHMSRLRCRRTPQITTYGSAPATPVGVGVVGLRFS